MRSASKLFACKLPPTPSGQRRARYRHHRCRRKSLNALQSFDTLVMCAVSVVLRLRHQVVDLDDEGSNHSAHPNLPSALRLFRPGQSPGSPVGSASRRREYTGWQIMRLI